MGKRTKLELNTILKAKPVSNPNEYIWIMRKQEDALISDDDIGVEEYSKERGIAYYFKGDKDQIVLWRFLRSKGWDEVSAEAFSLSYGAGLQDLSKAIGLVNEFNGASELNVDNRLFIYHELRKQMVDQGIDKSLIPKFNSQFDYIFKSQYMKDQMKKLADKSNIKFREFIKYAQEERADVVKSAELKKKEDKGFRLLGDQLEAFITKEYRKDESGEEVEITKHKLKTRFTSNKADLYWDITSKDAIKKAIDLMKSESDVLAIRFEHEAEDFGVWNNFWYEEIGGVLYGYAEGELDMNLSRAKDLWTEIYEYGKQFATSYGGRWIEYHIYLDEATEEVFRVFDEVKWEEISLTTRPANPDTALEVLNKYAKSLEECIDPTNELISNFNQRNMNVKTKPIEKSSANNVVLKSQEEEVTAAAETTPVVETPAKAEPEVVVPKADVTPEVTTPVVETPAEVVEPEVKTSEENKSLGSADAQAITKGLTDLTTVVLELQKSIKTVTEANESLTKRLEKIEDAPSEQKSTAELKNGEAADATPAFDVEAEAKKRYPFVSMIAKAMNNKEI